MITRHFSGNKNITIAIPDNLIWYTSTDESVVTPYNADVFVPNIISNTYTNGQGMMVFDGDVISIGEHAFWSCSSLTSITIPNSVTSIGNQAFCDCSSLDSITIPSSVTSIGINAFSGCDNLTSVTIPNSVTSIGESAFAFCSSLTSVTISDNVTSIGNWTFSECPSLASVIIGESVTHIGDAAFRGCFSLKTITCKAVTPPTLATDNDIYNVTAVYVPALSVDAYKTADEWSYYADKIQPIP